MKRTAIVALGLGLSLLGAPGASAAGQLDPRTPPQTAGPLTLATQSCGAANVRTSKGKVVARAVQCVFLYDFDPLSEADPVLDYSVGWFQSRIVPVNGWCVLSARSFLALEQGMTPDARTVENAKTRSPRRTRVSLPVTAGGTALEAGSVSQSYILQPRKLATSVSRDGLKMTQVWTGKTRKPIASAFGVTYGRESVDSFLSSKSISGRIGSLTVQKGC